MTEKHLRFWNRIVATEVFTVALITFGLTVEPTASFWDAGEYIATSAKLQVGHPPGAPLFQMMGASLPFCYWPRKGCFDGEPYVGFFKCFHCFVSLPFTYIGFAQTSCI